MDPADYPLLHDADLMTSLLRVTGSGAASVEEALTRLRRDLETAREAPPVSDGEILHRLDEARRHLVMAGLLSPVDRQHFRLTARGRRVLEQYPEGVDGTVLMVFPEYREYLRHRSRPAPVEDPGIQAYDEGYAAHGAGLTHSDNPYRTDTAAHLAWENGWYEARDEEIEHAPRTRDNAV